MNRLHEALERIASQGKGHYDATAHDIVSDDGSGRPWVHWATIAEDALAASRDRFTTEYQYRLMGQRDEAGREVARLREELRLAEARHRRLCQEAHDAGDRG